MRVQITRLDNGYFQEDSNKNCILIATLNYFQAKDRISTEKATDLVQCWVDLLANDPERGFTFPKNLPSTIEALTSREYRGRLLGTNALEYLQSHGVAHPERYGRESGETIYPLIHSYMSPTENVGHAVTALAQESKDIYHVVDNGKIEIHRALPKTLFPCEIISCKEN